ncbi:MAG TPA: hypothetical protein VNF29_10900 [Candidatus Binataceae bacterium]|nr:hypothetical protein [Candidatus Binataceae bacterium]
MEDLLPAKPPRQNITAARFRLWRERSLPRASYQIMPVFWTPAGLANAADLAPHMRKAVKRSEPSLSGLAYTPRRIDLVVAAGAASYEHVAKLIHCRALMRADPDYSEHRGKRVSMILLANQVDPAIADFARLCRVRVIVSSATPGAETAIAPAPASQINGSIGPPIGPRDSAH